MKLSNPKLQMLQLLVKLVELVELMGKLMVTEAAFVNIPSAATAQM